MSKPSISSCNIVSDIDSHFPTFESSISKVSPAISGYNDIEGLTFDIEGRQGSRCATGPAAQWGKAVFNRQLETALTVQHVVARPSATERAPL